MQIKVETNIRELERRFAGMKKQILYASAVALTRTAKDLQAAVPEQLERDLDRPTEFTKRGIYVVAARRDNLVATVGFKDRQARYMAYQIAGGKRDPGAGGIKLPGNIQLNAFGNVPRGLIGKLKAAAKDGTLGNTVARRIGAGKDRRKGAKPVQLFYGQPTGKGWEGAPVGIWRRVAPATPGGRGKLVPVVVFDSKPARYRARFNFAGLAQRVVASSYAKHFDAAFAQALRTAR
jgi:hypothetical protein